MRYELFDADGKSLHFENCCTSKIAVVYDNQTNLYWEFKSLNPESERFYRRQITWEEFNQNYIENLNAKNFGGFSDWRVPSKNELRSLINYRSINPAFPQEIFKNLVADDYWCGVTYGLREDCGWVINLNLGAATAKNKSLLSYCVAVRGEKFLHNNKRFIDNGDGTITDTVLKLMWQKNQNDRKSYLEVMQMLPHYEFAGYKDWRLPTMHELNSIFDESYADKSFYFNKIFECDKLQPPILQHITANLFENTYVWVTNFNFGYDGYYAEKAMSLCYCLVRSLTDFQESFKIPSSGQKEIFSAEGKIKGVNPALASICFGEFEDYICDMKTGLHYEKIFSDKKFTFAEANEHVKYLNDIFFGGINTWRLPTVDELRFIADYSGKTPAVFEKFKCYVKPDFYWTAEENSLTKGARAWAIYFGYGCAVPIDKNQKNYCIAVSGGYENLSDKSARRYKIESEVVTDNFTKLMWLRAELPLLTVAEAEKYFAENEIAGYKNWRIPDIKELSTIVNRSAEGGRWYDENLFPEIYKLPGMFFLARETFNGMFNWGINAKFAYDGYYADRLNGKYRIKAVRSVD